MRPRPSPEGKECQRVREDVAVFESETSSTKIRVPIRWNGLGWEVLGGANVIPRVNEGSIADLVIDLPDLESDEDRKYWTRPQRVELLVEESRVLAEIHRPPSPPKEYEAQFGKYIDAHAGGQIGVWVMLLEPLILEFTPGSPGHLLPCTCRIEGPNPEEEIESLNLAMTRISEQFEPHRKTHTGNVFDRVWVPTKRRWKSLGELRTAAKATLVTPKLD